MRRLFRQSRREATKRRWSRDFPAEKRVTMTWTRMPWGISSPISRDPTQINPSISSISWASYERIEKEGERQNIARNRGKEKKKREREREREREKGRKGANIVARWCNCNSAPVTRGGLVYDKGKQGEQREEERRKRPRIGRAYSRGTDPINPRDRCYLFIILLNVDRWGAKATALLSTPRRLFRNITSV